MTLSLGLLLMTVAIGRPDEQCAVAADERAGGVDRAGGAGCSDAGDLVAGERRGAASVRFDRFAEPSLSVTRIVR